MSKRIDINKIIDTFSNSFEFTRLSDYREPFIKDTIGQFYMMMRDSGYGDIAEWNQKLIFDLLLALTDQAFSDEDSQSVDVLMHFVIIVRAFLDFLISDGKLPISETDLDKVFDEYAAELGRMNEPDQEQFYDDPNLPQWREYIAQDISNYTNEWADAYIESAAWNKRSQGVTESILKTALGAMTDYIYNVYRKTPKTWTKKAINGTLTTYFVSNVGFDEADYQYIVPALSGLLTYVSRQGWLNEQRADKFKKYLAASESKMIELSKDSQNFSDSKLITLKMLEEGIDLEDKAAVQKYIDMLNKQGGIDYLRELAKNISEVKDPEETDIQDDKEIAEFSDPDPEQNYLKAPHVRKIDYQTWNRRVAIKNHTLGVQYGTKLLLERKRYDVPTQANSEDIILSVVQFVDVLYAQHLEKISEWSLNAWRELNNWLKQNQTEEQHDRTIKLLVSLMNLLAHEEVLSADKANGIIAVLQDKVIPLDKKHRNNH